VAFEVEENGSCVQGPDLDQVVHGTADAAISLMIQDHTVHFLRVSLEPMNGFAGRNLPDSDSAVVASANQRICMGSNCSNRMLMA
jgi:hypothetical protein